MNKRQQLESEIASLQEQLKKLDEQEQGQWVPEEGEDYWQVNTFGELVCTHWAYKEYNDKVLLTGNYFKTIEEAEKYRLRLQSMARKPYLPKEGEVYYYAYPHKGGWGNSYSVWLGDTYDHEVYLLGRVFKTEDEAKEWVEKFGEAWEI